MKLKISILLTACFLLTACGDRVGSEAWCAKQKDKPKSEWTMKETGDYAKYCVLHMDPEKWCEKMEEKDKGDWTANEAAEYAERCIVGRGD
jgi:hypothetical protein